MEAARSTRPSARRTEAGMRLLPTASAAEGGLADAEKGEPGGVVPLLGACFAVEEALDLVWPDRFALKEDAMDVLDLLYPRFLGCAVRSCGVVVHKWHGRAPGLRSGCRSYGMTGKTTGALQGGSRRRRCW